MRSLLFSLLLLAPAPTAQPRRIALFVPPGFSLLAEFERLSAWERRSGVEIEVRAEASPAPEGPEAVRLSALPLSPFYRRLLARFPVRVEPRGFVFDGRAYREPDDAIALSDPGVPKETLVFGNGARAVVRLAARRLFWREEKPPDYEIVSGDLSKRGSFRRAGNALRIDRATDRDEFASRDEFFRSLESERRGGAVWYFREAERPAVAVWEPVLRRFERRRGSLALEVRLFPDASEKSRDTGSSRPADFSLQGRKIRVDLDASAPAEPDSVSPVLAAAVFAAEEPRLAGRPTLLLALGARAAGRWWGRDVVSFAAFARAAGVEPSPAEVVSSDRGLSPVLAVGAAASWLEAGAGEDGEAAMRRALLGSQAALESALARWRGRAIQQAAVAPRRRPLPSGFLRGISYAMSNTVGGAYVSPRSRDTLERLRGMSVNAVSIMPYAWERDIGAPAISFVHRNPRGETDEGTVRAVSDAKALGMSAMVKPQIWVGNGRFVGEVAMRSEADWRAWFDAYRRFIVHHAVVAEAAGASLFCVGTELTGTLAEERRWRETIAAVRLATGAPLLYASNWAAGAGRVPVWDALDAIGVDFYDPLSTDPAASDAELVRGTRRAAEPVARLSRRVRRPVIFAEAGYPPVRSAWLAPHDEDSGRPAAPDDAARAIEAVFRALSGESWWKGVFWWKAFSDGRPARPGERGFNFLGTPAEKAIAAGFARLALEDRTR